MKAVLILIRWCAGIFFCMVALGGLLSGYMLAVLLILSIGLILLPPVTKFLTRKRNPAPINPFNIQPGFTPINRSIMQQQNIDESIIDVTGKPVSIPVSPANPKERTATYSSHTYIYSYDDIRHATKAQTVDKFPCVMEKLSIKKIIAFRNKSYGGKSFVLALKKNN